MTVKQKQNVLMVIPTIDRTGGAQHQLKILLPALERIGVSGDIYAAAEAVFDAKLMSKRGGSVLLPIARTLALIKTIRFALANLRKYDVVHLHGLGQSLYVFSTLGKLLGVPVIVKVPRTGPGSYLKLVRKSFARSLVFKSVKRCVSFFIILSPDGKAELSALGVPSSKIVELPNGIEVPNETHSKPNSPPLRICFAGRLIKRKNVDLLLKAFADAINSHDLPLKLTIIGDGPELGKLRQNARELGVVDCVTFTGEVSVRDVLENVSSQHVFVLPSNSEGMSNALLQACSNSCVPIAADIPQNRNIIIHEETGFLYESIDELPHLFKSLLEPEFRIRLAANSRQLTKRRFDIDFVAQKYSGLYSKLS